MRGQVRSRLWLALLAGLSLCAGEPDAVADTLDLLYIDANVDGSSGGHTALRLGDTVYHYQNDRGYTRLARDGWERFRFVYNDLENRSIDLVRLSVRTEDAERIRERLNLLYLVQSRQVEHLEDLQRDIRLLKSWRDDEPLLMPGAGFFAPTSQSATLSRLREQLCEREGPRYLANLQSRYRHRLQSLRYQPVHGRSDASLAPDRYPRYPLTFSERLTDVGARWFAVNAMQGGWAVAEDRLIDVSRLLPPGQASLTAPERVVLARYREQLQATILAELARESPAGGPALLLALARLEAVGAALDSGHLLVLDILPSRPASELRELSTEDRAALITLAERLHERLQQQRAAALSSAEPDEMAYQRLELAGSELHEIEQGLATGRALRVSRDAGPPEGLGYIRPPLPTVGHAKLDRWPRQAEEQAAAFLARLRAHYGYELLTRNCVTELARAIHSSFPDTPAIRAALGAYIEPGAEQGFIPFRFFELARQRYRAQAVRHLPAFRHRAVERLLAAHDDWLTAIRESMTLSSSVYESRAGDSAFLFFTERQPPWARPLLGSLNLGYALGVSAFGTLSAPFDQGLRLAEGLRGALFSLPELAGWNIRKGSFDELTVRAASRDAP